MATDNIGVLTGITRKSMDTLGLRNPVEINIPLIGEPPKPSAHVMVRIAPEAMHAFFELYYGLEEATENGTGYSPRTAEAMKKLKPYFARAEAKAAT